MYCFYKNKNGIISGMVAHAFNLCIMGVAEVCGSLSLRPAQSTQWILELYREILYWRAVEPCRNSKKQPEYHKKFFDTFSLWSHDIWRSTEKPVKCCKVYQCKSIIREDQQSVARLINARMSSYYLWG